MFDIKQRDTRMILQWSGGKKAQWSLNLPVKTKPGKAGCDTLSPPPQMFEFCEEYLVADIN